MRRSGFMFMRNREDALTPSSPSETGKSKGREAFAKTRVVGSLSHSKTEKIQGTVYFDAACGICQAGVRWFGRPFVKRGYRFRALQSPEAQAALNLKPGELPDEVKLVTADGRTLGGADMIVYLARFVWWSWPLHAFSRFPGVLPILRRLYRHIADNRHCVSGLCRIPPRGGRARHSLFSGPISVSTEKTIDTDDKCDRGGLP